MGLIRPRKRHKEALDLNLNITSLMDVLTVLLFFLLKSFSVTETTISIPQGIRLPAAVSDKKIEEAVTIAFLKDEIRSNEQVIMKLNQGKPYPYDVGGVGNKTWVPLKTFLDAEYARRNAMIVRAAEASGEPLDKTQLPPGRVLIQADRALDFADLKNVLHTAGLAGYSDYEFIINNPDED
jgi:biopolymer transport protein ExbD